MDIQSLKRWHWTMIGALAGAGLGWGQLSLRQEQRVGGEGYIEQEVFERELALPAVERRARFKDVIVYPVGDADIVQMQRLVRADGEWVYEPSRFAAPRPYRVLGRARSGPAAAATPADYSVRDYMRDVAQRDPRIQLKYAWWGFPPAVMGVWTAGAMVAIGGIWPVVLGFLVGAGFGRSAPEKPLLDLDQFKREGQPAAQGPTEADQLRLRELEEAMLLGLAKQAGGSAEQTPAGGTAEAAPAVKELKAAADEPTLPANAEDPKHYAGEFYPVARGHLEHEAPPARGS